MLSGSKLVKEDYTKMKIIANHCYIKHYVSQRMKITV